MVARRGRRARLLGGAFAVGLCLAGSSASALDKQGSAHGGAVDVDPDGFDMSGALTLGLSLYNPSYAARPDNTGHTLLRYAGHADVDLIGQRLSVPLDVNMFTDGDESGLSKIAPSELDFIGGLTTTWAAGPGAVEVGARIESDKPLGRDGASQFYGDLRGRFLYSLARVWPELASALQNGDVNGWVTLGWFTYNKSYFARPNNTGRAFLRYGLHTELSTFSDLWSFGLDATMFTDKDAGNPIEPSELDFTPELIYHREPLEVHLALETDLPVDRAGLRQQFLYALFVWSFDLVTDEPKPLEHRSGIPSP